MPRSCRDAPGHNDKLMGDELEIADGQAKNLRCIRAK
jgi:hypothetical protein